MNILQSCHSTMIFIIATALLILISVLVKLIKDKLTTKKALNLPPGSYGWPIIGETIEFLGAGLKGNPEKFMKDRCEKYSSEVFKTSLLGERTAVLCGPSGNKFLFSNENKLVTVWWPASVRKLLGNCVATSGGDEGKQMRKMVSCFMSRDASNKLYVKTMDSFVKKHMQDHWEGKAEVKVFPTIKSYTFELACRLFMSLEDSEQIARLATLFNIFLRGIISAPLDFPGTRFYYAKRATIAIKKELQKTVRQRRCDLQQKLCALPKDFLSHFLTSPDEFGKFMPESIIVNNVVMLLFAGHDTSSVAITMVMKYLAELPDVYERVLKEQNEVARCKEGEFLNWEDIQKMKYTWNVVCEVSRLSPPVMGAFREAVADISYEGYNIPKGWKLYWSACMTHKDPRLYEEHLKFDPSRFEGSGPAPFSYVPFGGGPRMCLGKEYARLEILIFLHNVIRRFKWNLVVLDEKTKYDPMPTPEQGLPIFLFPRAQS